MPDGQTVGYAYVAFFVTDKDIPLRYMLLILGLFNGCHVHMLLPL